METKLTSAWEERKLEKSKPLLQRKRGIEVSTDTVPMSQREKQSVKGG